MRKALKVKSKCPSLKKIVQVGGKAAEGTVDFKSTLSEISEKAHFKGSELKWTDPALIFFTSGTTGPPKMVLHNQISYPMGTYLEGAEFGVMSVLGTRADCVRQATP